MEGKTFSDFVSLPYYHLPRFYNTDHKSRGRAIVFNHKNYGNECLSRTGTDEDVKNLKIALLTLGFQRDEITIFNDLSSYEIQTELMKVQRDDHTNRDLLMIFVLTHGGFNDNIFAYDTDYPVKKLWEPFTADKCKTLAGKPKIFFVIACRGMLEDHGAIKEENKNESKTEVDAKPITSSRPYLVPIWSDFLYVFSTYEGFCSYRDVEQGTWYIKAFCDELEKTDISSTSFLDFLTYVNGKIAMTYETNPDSKKQIPIFSSTLTKSLFLENKKIYRESSF